MTKVRAMGATGLWLTGAIVVLLTGCASDKEMDALKADVARAEASAAAAQRAAEAAAASAEAAAARAEAASAEARAATEKAERVFRTSLNK